MQSEHVRGGVPAQAGLQQGHSLRHVLAQLLVLALHGLPPADGRLQLAEGLRGLVGADAVVEPVDVQLCALADGALGLYFPSISRRGSPHKRPYLAVVAALALQLLRRQVDDAAGGHGGVGAVVPLALGAALRR